MVRSTEAPSDFGFTLIELLVVLSILTMVLGMSVSVFRSFGEGQSLEIAASQVSTAVRAARNWSVSTGMPSRVMVDPDNRTVTAFGFSTVAAWDFESPCDRQTLRQGCIRRLTGEAFKIPCSHGAETESSHSSVIRVHHDTTGHSGGY